jgi:hypothetical protein
VTFLGPVDYSATVYVYTDPQGEEHRYATPYFAEALVHFFPDLTSVQLLVTPTVSRHANVQALRQRLGDRLTITEIPESQSENALWGIFDALTEVVEEGDRVVFDITNSFRYIPFLTFLAAAYLRTARRIKVEAVLYGAFEARDRDTHDTPVFNLTPFVQLLDWLTATNQFIYTGDAKYLARLLSDAGHAQRSRALGTTGRKLRELSLAMMLCRPLEVMETAGDLDTALADAQADLASYARPFELLADRIREEYADHALAEPTADENVAESLRQQVALINWYLDNNQAIQAMTLAREWLITAVGWKLGKGFPLKLAVRERSDGDGVAWGISGLEKLGTPMNGEIFDTSHLSPVGKELHSWPESELIADAWRQVRIVRNELDHAGMNPGPMPVATLARKAQRDAWPAIKAVAEQWDLLPQ